MNKTNDALKLDVENELRWDPMLDATMIGVVANNGVISLNGTVTTFAQKNCASDAAWRVTGVRSLKENLNVQLLTRHEHADEELATAAESALKWDVWVPSAVTARVSGGIVTLEGHASWNFQRNAAERAVSSLEGVTGVNNRISLKPVASAERVQENVESALMRQARVDAKAIHVSTVEGKVTLSGSASTRHAINDASKAAWSAPGVTEVIDLVTLE